MAVNELHPDSAVHRLASDPARHVWVSAHAGTGKTRALVDRITRLLLSGAEPSGLLAITFTRTAAAEMQGRLFDRLARWAGLDDAALEAELRALGEDSSACRLARARGLLAKVLEASPGLEIRTIHATAQSILAAFPLEAGLGARVEPLDERRAADLKRQALAQVLAEAAADPAGRAAADVETIAVEAGEARLLELLPDFLRPGVMPCDDPAEVEPLLRGIVGLDPEAPPERLVAQCLEPPHLEEAWVRALAAGLRAMGTSTKAREAAEAEAWLSLDAEARCRERHRLVKLVRTAKGEPRHFEREVARVPALAEPLERLLEATARLMECERALTFVAHAGAWARVGLAVARAYRGLKQAAAAIDFDDMVHRAARLLEADGMAGFVAMKLDRTVTHVLVDEAQDTNADQWRLIEGLVAEFDSGLGQRPGERRTRFVVGDFKQAIYGFQGTDPRVFQQVHIRWSERARAAGDRIDEVPLARNFRSAPVILKLVDRVLANLGPEALGLSRAPAPHEPADPTLPGCVWLLPPMQPPEGADDEEDDDPPDPRFAEALAQGIANLVREGSPHRLVLRAPDGSARPAGPGDVLILLQARGDLMAGLVRALHGVGLPVAGVDRARLAEPLAARDLLSLVRFVLQPADDLALAEVLVSPLGGLDHETIRRLRTPGLGLWEALRAAPDPTLQDVRRFLEDALTRADYAPPHGFLQAILAQGARARLKARLGPEADDGIDALLAEAWAFGQDRPATLQGFLAHVERLGEAVGRDPDASPGLVRILTIHAAKGLEAPIVVLADAFRRRKPAPSRVRWTHARGELPLVYGARERLPAALEPLARAEDQALEAEHHRLLYVALTRPRQVLVVAGQMGVREARARAEGKAVRPAWHDHVRTALNSLGAQEADGPFGRAVRLAEGVWPEQGETGSRLDLVAVPDWARRAPPTEAATARRLVPSAAAEEPPAPPPPPDRAQAIARGLLLHRLFDRLPAVPAHRRDELARRVVAAAGLAGPAAEEVVATALATLAHPDLAPLFAPDALAEAPVAGVVGDVAIAGTIDRLRVGPHDILLADFKTGHEVPQAADAVPVAYLRQMAAYRAVLMQALPGRSVRAWLVYTTGPRILELPPDLLEGHHPVARAPAAAI